MGSDLPVAASNSPQPTASAPAPNDVRCTTCSKGEFTAEAPLKYCKKCEIAPYCSYDCQMKDWKRHDTECWPKQRMAARVAPENSHLHMAPPAEACDLVKEFPQKQSSWVYRLLIETYRVWDEDQRIREGKMMDPSISIEQGVQYCVGYSILGCQQYLNRLSTDAGAQELLPDWWSAEDLFQTEQLANREYHWMWKDSHVPKEVNERNRYGGPEMRRVLKEFAELIWALPTPPPSSSSSSSVEAMEVSSTSGDDKLIVAPDDHKDSSGHVVSVEVDEVAIETDSD